MLQSHGPLKKQSNYSNCTPFPLHQANVYLPQNRESTRLLHINNEINAMVVRTLLDVEPFKCSSSGGNSSNEYGKARFRGRPEVMRQGLRFSNR